MCNSMTFLYRFRGCGSYIFQYFLIEGILPTRKLQEYNMFLVLNLRSLLC